MSIFSGSDIEGLLISQAQISMQNALLSLSASGETENNFNSQGDSLASSLTSVTGPGTQSLDGDAYLSGGLTGIPSSAASVMLPALTGADSSTLFTSGRAASIFSDGYGIENHLGSGYESFLSNTMDMMLENPAQTLLAQANASSMSVLDLFG